MEESTERIDLNHASIDVLSTIPGIGPKLAARIVDYREQVHPFEEIIELAAVPGISETMVRSIEEHIAITPISGPSMEEEPDEQIPEPEEAPSEEVEEDGNEEDEADALSPESAQADNEEDEIPIVLLSRASSDEAVGEAVPIPEAEPVGEEMGEVAAAALDRPRDEAPPADEAESAGLEEEEPGIEPADAGRSESGDGQLMAAPSGAGPYRMPEARAAQGGGRWIAAALSGALLGALIGALLTLFILYLINDRALRFASAASASDLREEISGEADNAQRERAALEDQLGDLVERAESLSAESESLDQDLRELARSLAGIETDVVELQDKAGDLSERIDTVAAAAEDFDAFLGGLQELLIQLRGTEEGATPPAEATPTPSAPAAGADEELPTPSPTAGLQPTRTPRPTATPFTVPGATQSPTEG